MYIQNSECDLGHCYFDTTSAVSRNSSFCLFTEKKQNPISAQVWSTKRMVSAQVIPKRLVHLIEERSGFDCSGDFFEPV